MTQLTGKKPPYCYNGDWRTRGVSGIEAADPVKHTGLMNL